MNQEQRPFCVGKYSVVVLVQRNSYVGMDRFNTAFGMPTHLEKPSCVGSCVEHGDELSSCYPPRILCSYFPFDCIPCFENRLISQTCSSSFHCDWKVGL